MPEDLEEKVSYRRPRAFKNDLVAGDRNHAHYTGLAFAFDGILLEPRGSAAIVDKVPVFR